MKHNLISMKFHSHQPKDAKATMKTKKKETSYLCLFFYSFMFVLFNHVCFAFLFMFVFSRLFPFIHASFMFVFYSFMFVFYSFMFVFIYISTHSTSERSITMIQIFQKCSYLCLFIFSIHSCLFFIHVCFSFHTSCISFLIFQNF